MKRSARFGPHRRHRYSLKRQWTDLSDGGNWVTFIMLNPSTADEQQDDPTIRRCISFAKSWGGHSLEIVNLFSLVTTDPRVLPMFGDSVGEKNDEWIMAASQRMGGAGIVVAAWGVRGKLWGRGNQVLSMLHEADVNVRSFGLTKDGYPKHPLYLKRTAPILPL